MLSIEEFFNRNRNIDKFINRLSKLISYYTIYLVISINLHYGQGVNIEFYIQINAKTHFKIIFKI